MAKLIDNHQSKELLTFNSGYYLTNINKLEIEKILELMLMDQLKMKKTRKTMLNFSGI